MSAGSDTSLGLTSAEQKIHTWGYSNCSQTSPQSEALAAATLQGHVMRFIFTVQGRVMPLFSRCKASVGSFVGWQKRSLVQRLMRLD
mmetsp:Transcript_42255/g.97805  ORF Transcript_42255/g.97805 Transcript_42255/m.97805 type:complete len:87 (+) Transcript_42255:124-384(+)